MMLSAGSETWWAVCTFICVHAFTPAIYVCALARNEAPVQAAPVLSHVPALKNVPALTHVLAL